MTMDDDISRQLISTFKDELEEHLQTINQDLLALEQGAEAEKRRALLEEVFREAHSLKGAARAVGIENIEKIAHGLENIFAAAKRDELVIKSDVCDLIYSGLDKIGQCMASYLKSEPIDFGLQEFLGRLAAVADGNSQDVDVAEEIVVVEEEELKPDGAASDGERLAVEVEETIRVKTKKLDNLMSHVEEMLVARIRTEQRLAELRELSNFLTNWSKNWYRIKGYYGKLSRGAVKEKELAGVIKFLGINDRHLKRFSSRLSRIIQDFSKDNTRLSLTTENLQLDIRAVRMLPVASVFNSYRRMVRDIARQQEKEVQLRIVGQDTEIDKKVLEGIKDPLMHLIRNSIDHGIEKPKDRLAAGKSRIGTIVLRASQTGGNILIEIEDDGRGIDVAEVKRTALEKGIISRQDSNNMSEREILFSIFTSGFSTSPIITDVSGRGVGLDVVRRNVENLNGLINVSTKVGEGCKFSISLPLTLTTSRALMAQVGGETFAVPTSSVERILRISQQEIVTIGGKEAIKIAGRPLSLVRLDRILELKAPALKLRPRDKVTVIILGAAEKRIAFIVDKLVGEMEIVIKSLGKLLARVRNVSGATILGTGKVVMILNVSDLIKSARHFEGRAIDAVEEEKSTGVSRNILVVDDSITTRTLEKNILESVGFSVFVAQDGREALEKLAAERIDLVVSDVDMERMDGLELTAEIKGDERYKNLPVVLVTALESQADRERGIEVGADAYLVKSSFEQKKLVETIEQLI